MVTEQVSDPTSFLRNVIHTDDADDVWSDLEEPVISHKESFEFKTIAEALVSATCEVEYLPISNYIQARSLKEYLTQFKEFNVIPATIIKTIVMDLVKTIQPAMIQVKLTVYSDGTVHSLVLSWQKSVEDAPTIPTNKSEFPDVAPTPGKPDEPDN